MVEGRVNFKEESSLPLLSYLGSHSLLAASRVERKLQYRLVPDVPAANGQCVNDE